VLDGLPLPESLVIQGFVNFGSYDPNEPYDCVVAEVWSEQLVDMNTQLRVLPNIDTFIEYRPHITIGYFKAGWFLDNYHSQFAAWVGSDIKTKGFNYGDMLSTP
jgi:hypothetical protein